MSNKTSKKDAEKFQHQLLELLKDECNRICADCHARGPRWASWNLGVFICIRCAGIHRNLGVHIAKVKSVNLDTWTQEQVDNMLAWGNGIANEYYEYKLPADFRRPNNDSSAEKFIRKKYEQKLYVHENFDYASSVRNHPTESDSASSSRSSSSRTDVKPVAVNAPTKSIPVVPLKTKSEAYVPPKIPPRNPSSNAAQPRLLQVAMTSAPSQSTSTPPQKVASKNDLVDLFGDMVSAPITAPSISSSTAPFTTPSTASSTAPYSDNGAVNLLSDVKEEAPKQSVKDSIMSLYGSSVNSTFAPAPNNTFVPQSNSFQMPQSNGFQSNFSQQSGTMNQGFPASNQQFNGMTQQSNQQLNGMTQQPYQQFNGMAQQPNQQFNGMSQQSNQQLNGMAQQPNQQFNGMAQQPNQQLNGMAQQSNQQFNGMGQQSQQFMQPQGMFGMQQQQQMMIANQMIMSKLQKNPCSQTQQFNQFQNGMQGQISQQQPNNFAMFSTNAQSGVGVQGVNIQQQQFGSYNMQSQQQQLDSVQRQLQQMKVGPTQHNWAQAFGSS